MSVIALVTAVGAAKFTAARQGQAPPIVFDQLVVGNGQPDPNGYAEYEPDAGQIALIGQRDAVAVTSTIVTGSKVTVGAILSADRGDYWITEVGLVDPEGDLLLIAAVTPIQKVAGIDQAQDVFYQIPIQLSEADTVVIQTDPSTVYVTYDVLLAALQEASVKGVRHGSVTLAVGELTRTVALNPPINKARSFLHASGRYLSNNGHINISYRIMDDNTLEFARTLLTDFAVEIEYQLIEWGTSFVLPGNLGEAAPEAVGDPPVSQHTNLETIGHVSRVWTLTTPGGEPFYSTPIGPIMMDDGDGTHDIPSIAFQGWDWFIYIVRVTDGTVVWKKATGGPCYGRCQAADVNGNGWLELFGASHDGQIWSQTDDGANRWQHQNLYDREAAGTATGGAAASLEDATKAWVPDSFTRSDDAGLNLNATIEITAGTGAGQIRQVQNCGLTTINVFDAWDTVPDETSDYVIHPYDPSDKKYMHAGTLHEVAGTWFLYVTGFDGQVVKLNADTGALVWKYATREQIEPFPVVIDLDGDGNLEVLAVGIDGFTHCLNEADGTLKWKAVTNPADAFIKVADINNDGDPEVLIASRDNTVHILDKDGAETGRTLNVGADIDSSPLLIDGPGGVKHFISGNDAGSVYRFDETGLIVWSQVLSSVHGFNSSPVLADIDGDGQDEILIASMGGVIYILTPNGDAKGSLYPPGPVEGTPLIGDLDGDGKIEMVVTCLNGQVVMYRFNNS